MSLGSTDGATAELVRQGPSRRALAGAGAAFGVVAVAGVTWAKWYPALS